MKRILLLVAWMLFSGLAVQAQILKMGDWRLQSGNAQDGIVNVKNDYIELTRGSQGADKYTLRAYQDVTVTPGTIYQLSYKIKVKGKGLGGGLIYPGNKQGKWEGKNIKYAPRQRQCDFKDVKVNLAAGKNIVKFRVDLRAQGAYTKVIYKDIKLEEVGKEQDIVLMPGTAEIKVDGKLDDRLWKNAVKLSGFKVLGNVSRNSKTANEVMLTVKDGYLYVAYRMEEPKISGMKVTKMDGTHDMADTIGIYADDCAETFISPERLSYAHLLVNPAGVKHWDQKNIGKPSTTWYPTDKSDFTGSWEAAAQVGKNEWTCELRIKLSSLFGEEKGGRQQLFVNFTRHRTQGNEPNLTLAPLAGKFYAVPNEFIPVTLVLPPVSKRKMESADIVSEFTKRLGVPELLLAGNPVKWIKNPGKFKLAEKVDIEDKSGKLDAIVKKQLNKALISSEGSGSLKVVLTVDNTITDSLPSSVEQAKMKSLEAFKLELTAGKAVVTGRTKDGLLRGIATLVLLANRIRFLDGVELEAFTLYDAPRMKNRGWLVGDYDPKEVKRMIDTAFLLRFNQIFIALDSFGGPTKFPFSSFPIGSKSSTKQDWIGVFNYARARGIEPIPYFSSWGRVQYLKNMPGGIKFLVDDVDVIQKTYRNLDVANPEACKVMLKLQEEIIDTLKPKSFCIAMDEIHYGHTVNSPMAKAKHWNISDWFVEAVKINDAFFKKKGVKMYIYGDMIDPEYNGKHMDMSGTALLKRLPKDMVVLDWKYDGEQNYTVDFPSIKMFKDSGLQTVGCPWFRTKNIPRLANSIKRYNAEGMCLTSWNTTRIDQLKPELIRALSMTAFYSWSPEDCNLAHWKFVPDAIMEGAAYWSKTNFPARKVTHIKTGNNLIGGSELIKALFLPQGTDTAVLAVPFKNYRGVTFDVFRKAGKPAAVMVAGMPGRTAGTVVNGDFSYGAGMDGWSFHNASGKFTVIDGMLKVTAPKNKEFMRAYQDILLDPKKNYSLTYKVKADGPGIAKVWIYPGDSKFKWDSSKIINSRTKSTDLKTVKIQLHQGYGSVRICFAADGPGTTACFDDIELVESGAGFSKNTATSGVEIPVGSKAQVITFMHATSHQVLVEDMARMGKKFASYIPGQYVVAYSDGVKVRVPLTYRVNIVAANDNTLGRDLDVGLFGTVGHTRFLNIPTYTWINPYPGKVIKSINVVPGNSKDMSLILFGISLDSSL